MRMSKHCIERQEQNWLKAFLMWGNPGCTVILQGFMFRSSEVVQYNQLFMVNGTITGMIHYWERGWAAELLCGSAFGAGSALRPFPLSKQETTNMTFVTSPPWKVTTQYEQGFYCFHCTVLGNNGKWVICKIQNRLNNFATKIATSIDVNLDVLGLDVNLNHANYWILHVYNNYLLFLSSHTMVASACF